MSPSKRKGALNNVASQPPAKRVKEDHSSDGEFQVVRAALTLSVPPVFAANPRVGIEEMLDSMIMRYIPSLQGVVLSHSSLVFVNREAIIQRDCPFLICKVAFDATVWSPRVGLKLSGKINLCSPDHISLLVHRTFNVSIPRHHIPTDTWEFEYGPAENDPEYGAAVQEVEGKANDETDKEHESGGKWVHKVTGKALGGKTGVLDFTVIGLTVANEMLSLLGSLQSDPFSSRHTVDQQPESQKQNGENLESDEDSDATSSPASEGSSEGEDSEGDTFRMLGKRKDLQDLKGRNVSGKKK